MSEFALIDAFLAPFGLSREERSTIARGRAQHGRAAFPRVRPSAAGVLQGPGDDCAALAPSRGMQLVATTDAALDGVHFQLGRCTPEDAGWKALAMNLSDLAAAGARPRWFLCALGVPQVRRQSKAQSRSIARGLGRGMAALARESGCALVGGNVTRASEWSLTLTALGEAKRPLSRAGGRPGDRLILVGELGAAALGLRLLQRKKRGAASREERARDRATALGADERAAVQAQLRPRPQLEAGRLARALASAAIDLSDGLLQDLGHLCARSGCGARLELDALPRSAAVRALEQAGKDLALTLAGGEEYALLLAAPPARARLLLRKLRRAKLPAAEIGGLTPRRSGSPAIALFSSGRAVSLPRKRGHDHLR